MKAWSQLLNLLDNQLGKLTVDKWLRTLKIVKFDAANLYLDAADTFQINWFKEYVSHLLPKYFLTGRGKPIRIYFTIGGKSLFKQKKTIPEEEISFAPDPLEPHATLETFILSEGENISYKIFSELIDSTLKIGSYNPIYIYGPKGSGKTHLLMGITQALIEQGKKCFFVHSETFTGHVIKAFRSGLLQEFRKAYRGIEVLIIDDVHLFSRKIATQEELFHTFNRLHTSGLQIILGAALPPHMLEDIEERLISRFEWGITIPVTSPSLMERTAILESRAQALSLPLSPSIKHFLTTHFNNLHSLIRALEALALRFPESKQTIDLEMAQFHLKDLINKETEETLTPEKILKGVANSFGIKKEDILGKSQIKEYTLPRQIAMYLCRNKLQMSFLKIGRFFSRDHSTVMSSVKRIKKGIEKKEEALKLPLSDIQRRLN